MQISAAHLEELNAARILLENPGFIVKLASALGTPIETGLKRLPQAASDVVQASARKALSAALELAIRSMDGQPGAAPWNWSHKIGVTLSGGIGGAFGLLALPIELPLSTTIMFRSIADIAASNGEAIASTDTKLACIQVFALGGESEADDAAESGYFAVRSALAGAVSNAARHLAHKGVAKATAPPLVRLISQVATRFGVVVSQKLAAQAVPIVGAAGGATINFLFLDHFQSMARGHFTVRRLERIYGVDLVRETYANL